MSLSRIGLAALIALLIPFVEIGQSFNFQGNLKVLKVLAQTTDERKAEADRLLQQGIEQYQTSQSEAALQSWQQALSIYREIKNRQGEGFTLLNLGNAYLFSGNYPKAIELYQQSLVIIREIKNRRVEGVVLLNLGLAYNSLRDYPKAIEYLQQHLPIAKEIKDRQAEGNALLNLGLAYYFQGDYPKGIEYFQKSLAIAWEINNRELERLAQQALLIASNQNNPRKAEADRLLQQGIEQYKTSQSEAALQSWQQALIIYQEIKDRPGERNVLSNLGLAYNSLGDYPKAIEYLQQSLAIAKEIKDLQVEGNALNNLGNAYNLLGDYPKAIEYLQQSLFITRSIKDRRGEGAALGNLGLAYNSLGDYPKAIEFYQQSLVIAREIKDRHSEGTALRNLGLTYDFLGDYPKAIEYLQQSLVIAREIKDRHGEGTALLNLGNAYDSLGDYSKAIEYRQQSLVITREIKDRHGEGAALGNLGSAYNFLGDYPKAIEHLQQSLVIAREIKDRQGEGAALGNLGNAYNSLGDYPTAIKFYQQSLAIAREIKDQQTEGTVLGNLGLVYYSLEDYPQAINYHEQNLAIALSIKDRSSEGRALNNLGLALFKEANLTAAETNLTKAIEVYESLRGGLKDSEKVSIIDKQSNSYRILQQVLIAQNKPDTALEISERSRARAFIELLAQRFSPNPQQSLPDNFLKPTIFQLKQIAKIQNATLVQYSIISDDFKLQGKQQWKESALYIWVIKPTGEVTFRQADLKPLWQQQNTSLTELVFTSRDSIGVRNRSIFEVTIANPQPQNSTEKLQQLHQVLIAPITDLLPTDPDRKVIFIPQTSLFFAPFPALIDPTGKYLIEKHTILTAPSIQVLELTHQQRLEREKNGKKGEVLIVGNPTMPKVRVDFNKPPQQLLSLPGAEREAKAIAPLFNTQPFIGSQATKASILQKMPSAQIIHLATHGLLDNLRGLGSAIALAPSGNDNGLLTAEEILDLKLNAELVVLSACDTGRGRVTGDGIIGLSRSLINAGVPSVIVSLWAVPDSPTAFLMTEFYNQLKQNPNKAQALRQAMLTTMKNHPDPKDWAAFTLIGEAE